MQKQQCFFWHVHHGDGLLVEWCHSYDERAEYIRTDKSPGEQELRLRLFQPVRGQLPQEVVEAGEAFGETLKVFNEMEVPAEVWKTCLEASKALSEAWEARNRSWKTCFGVLKTKSYVEAMKAYKDAVKAYDEAEKAHRKAGKAYFEERKSYIEVLSNHKDEVGALHTEECPDCPWDGKTIFPKALAAV